MNWTKHIPNFLTLVNLFLGCLALVYIFYDHILFDLTPNSSGSGEGFFDGKYNLEKLHYGKLHIAALLVFVAVFVDFLDGFAARALNAKSSIGAQLDSLADLVTFGVVPGMITYYLLGIAFFDSVEAFNLGILVFLPGFFLTLAGAWRLAVFNTRYADAVQFHGLAIPAMALFIASLPLILIRGESAFAISAINNPFVLYIIILFLSYLMVSRLPMFSLKFAHDGMNKVRYGFITICVALLVGGYIFFKVLFLMVPAIVILYIILSIVLNFQKNEIQSGDQRDAPEGTS